MPKSKWEYFKLEEFACKHCGENKMQHGFISALNELRRRCGFALAVTSGHRCPVHNARVSTTGANGPHTTGRAVDLRVDRGRAFWVLHYVMEMNAEAKRKGSPLPFTGLGFNQKGDGRFLHLDSCEEPQQIPRPTVWSY